jgi:hypothetical protein
MKILDQLSSAQGDKTENSNRKVAKQCIKTPKLLNDIASGFNGKNKKMESDCIEVFTIISESNPELIIPFTDNFLPLLASKETKTRWEAVHTLSFIADKIPDIIHNNSTELTKIIETDKSTIVRDYAIDTISNYSKSGKQYSEKAFEILVKALNLWGEKHAKQVLKGLNSIILIFPEKKNEIKEIIRPYLESKKKVVAIEANKILKQIEK